MAMPVMATLPELARVRVMGKLVAPCSVSGNCSDGGVSRTPAAIPTPKTDRVWGLPGASSAMLIRPVRVPVTVGVKFTVTPQLLPARTVAHELTAAKSPEPVMLVMCRSAVPELKMVKPRGRVVFSAWLPKLSTLGEKARPGAMPEPARGMVCGLLSALSTRAMPPVAGPVVAGVNVTDNVQLAPMARLAPQSLDWLNGPEAMIEVIATGAEPGLETVMVCA